MRIEFYIVTLKHPKHAKDFVDYCIAHVKVTECDKPELLGRTMTWKGKLPACVPYFVFSCESGVYEDETGVSLTCRENTVISCKAPQQQLAPDVIKYMLENEIGQSTKDNDFCTRTVVNMLRSKLALQRRKGSEERMKHVPCVFETVANDTLYYRAPLLLDIQRVYGAERTRKFQAKLSFAQTKSLWEDLGFSASSSPERIFALLRRENPYKAKPLTFAQFGKCPAIVLASLSIQPFQWTGVRLLDFYRSLGNHTGHVYDHLRKRYLAENPQHAPLYDRAFWWLVGIGVFVWERSVSMVSESHTHKRATEIVQAMTKLFTQFDPEMSLQLLRDVEDNVPCIPPLLLTDEQTRACLHMLNNPFTMVCGPPGRGKTTILEVAVAYWKRVLGVSFVGTNVASHRERCGGHAEISHTAHYIYYQGRSAPGTQWLSQIDAVVWDEFANVDDALVAKTLGSFPNLQRFVTILDPWQIHPLKAGMPAIDLLEAFPDCVFNLTINKRMEPAAKEMGDAVLHILKGEPQNIEWSHALTDLASMTMITPNDRRGGAAAVIGGVKNKGDSHGLELIITRILRHICANPDFYNVRSIMDVQFIAFRRAVRDQVNEIVEHVGNALGLIQQGGNGYDVRKGLRLYQGCKICIRGDNFPARPDQDYDAVRNGEVGIVTSISMVSDGSACIVTFRSGTGTNKRMLLDKRLHVDPASVFLGHAITANAAQGCEYQTVVGVLHEGAEREQWICRGHMYVMSSRARRAFICANATEAQFNTICYRVEPRRSTILKPLLSFSALPLRGKAENEIQLRDHAEMHLRTAEDKKKGPCVPILQFVGPK